MRLTRVYRFSASHRLHSPSLGDDENTKLYGKCNNPYGHGHDYVIHVSVRGEVQKRTGRIVEISKLDEFVRHQVLSAYDHRDMNLDLEDFRSRVPTTENVAAAIHERLSSDWSAHFGDIQLDGLLIEETARNTFELRR